MENVSQKSVVYVGEEQYSSKLFTTKKKTSYHTKKRGKESHPYNFSKVNQLMKLRAMLKG